MEESEYRKSIDRSFKILLDAIFALEKRIMVLENKIKSKNKKPPKIQKGCICLWMEDKEAWLVSSSCPIHQPMVR